MPYHPHLLEQVLRDVNTFRAEFMLPPLAELPKGYTRNSESCVIANALDNKYSVTIRGLFEIGAPDVECSPLYAVTPSMATFITLFDDGAIPELVAS